MHHILERLTNTCRIVSRDLVTEYITTVYNCLETVQKRIFLLDIKAIDSFPLCPSYRWIGIRTECSRQQHNMRLQYRLHVFNLSVHLVLLAPVNSCALHIMLHFTHVFTHVFVYRCLFLIKRI